MTSRATPNNQLLTLGPWMSELLYKSPCSSWPCTKHKFAYYVGYRQWYKRGLTTYTYNSGHMKMESNRLPEWLGLSTIWICMYCTLIYKTTSYGNHNIKWHVWYTGKAIISDVNVKCKIPVLVNLKVWKILKWSFMELMLKE